MIPDLQALRVWWGSMLRLCGAGWGTALISIASRVWQEYGDIAVLNETFPAMQLYLNNLLSLADPSTGLLTFGDFGDWNPPNYTEVRSCRRR